MCRYFIVNDSEAAAAGCQELPPGERALVFFDEVERVTLWVVLGSPITAAFFVVGTATHGPLIVDFYNTGLHFPFSI